MTTKENMVVVYQAKNRINGKRYVGVTSRGLRARERGHRREADSGRGSLLHAAIRKYGHDNIVFEVLQDFNGDYDLAKLYEQEYIAKYRPEYNLTGGGEGGTLAVSTRLKIAAAHLGRKRSAEARANMSAAQRRRGAEHPPDAETREKMRQAKLGRKHRPESLAKMVGRKDSPETRAKKAAAQTGRPATKGKTGQATSAETREKIRHSLRLARWVDTPARAASRARTGTTAAREARKIPVRCLGDGMIFESVRAAAEFYELDPAKLGAAIRAQRAYRDKQFERLPKPQ